MRVLGIDTATAVAAIGVVNEGTVLADVVEVSPAGHSGCLSGLIARAFDLARLRVDDVEGIAVSVGPGSFTGLRVGLSFAKGMAFAGRSRLVGVSTLEALAWQAPQEDGVVAAAIDARREEVYLALFRRAGPTLERMTPDLALSPQAAVERIGRACGTPGGGTAVGDAAERYPAAFAPLHQVGVRVVSFEEVHPRGGVIAALGERRLRTGERADLEAIVPTYVRASSAERNLGKLALTREKSVS